MNHIFTILLAYVLIVGACLGFIRFVDNMTWFMFYNEGAKDFDHNWNRRLEYRGKAVNGFITGIFSMIGGILWFRYLT